MGYLSAQELQEARRLAAKARDAYCAQCQATTPHLKPNFFTMLRNVIGRGRVCLDCGWAHVHKPITNKALRRAVFAADAYECVYCGGTERLSIDHIVPQSHGGSSVFENLVTACHWCNASKGDGRRQLAARYGRYR